MGELVPSSCLSIARLVLCVAGVMVIRYGKSRDDLNAGGMAFWVPLQRCPSILDSRLSMNGLASFHPSTPVIATSSTLVTLPARLPRSASLFFKAAILASSALISSPCSSTVRSTSGKLCTAAFAFKICVLIGWIAAGSSCNVIGATEEFPPGVVGRVVPAFCWRSSIREIRR